MNYLNLVKSFCGMHKKGNFTGNEALFYVLLVNAFSDAGDGSVWPDSLRLMDGEVCTLTGLSPNCMKKVRDGLATRQIIAFESVGKGYRSGGIYELIDPPGSAKRTSKRTSNNDDLLAKERQKDSQNDDQNLTNSHIYIESKPSNLQTDKNKSAEADILEVDSVEVFADDFAQSQSAPNPLFRPPPFPAQLGADEQLELDSFTQKLLTSSRLLFALSSALGVKGEPAIQWIEAFALDQWTAGELDKKTDAQWQQHCKRWIADQLAKQIDRENQRQSKSSSPSRTRNDGSGRSQSRTETGSEIDRLVGEVFGT